MYSITSNINHQRKTLKKKKNLFVTTGRERRMRELLGLKAFTPLLLQILFALALTDLNHVVLSSSSSFVGIYCHFVPVSPDFSPRARSQRHLFLWFFFFHHHHNQNPKIKYPKLSRLGWIVINRYRGKGKNPNPNKQNTKPKM